jgi:galactose mutarotase-like enzyme
MFTIENEYLTISIRSKGAELDNIYSKKTRLEYLWSGDAKYWSKKSPVLFPIVGTLKNNTYYHNNKPFHLTRHGFARDREFAVTASSTDAVTFTLLADEKTLEVFPFNFQLNITYSLIKNSLQVDYAVTNKGNENMYFSIGGHPAFKVPLEEGLEYDDYYFEFSNTENARRWMISNEGLIEAVTVPLITNDNKLPLSKDLFLNDAVVFKYLNSETITLKTDRSEHGIELTFPGFPFLGLWAPPNADFICIEPWCGISDSVTSTQQLINKEGIHLLTPTLAFDRKWTATFY